MRWSKLKNTLAEHPYWLHDAFQISIKEAKAIQAKEGYPPFEEMVLRAKAKSTLPQNAWQAVDAALCEARPAAQGKPHLNIAARRWAVAGLCALLLGSYLAFAPSGRALAMSFAKVVVRFLDNGFLFTPVPDAYATPQPFVSSMMETVTDYPNFDAVEAATGRELLRLRGNTFSLESLTLYDNNIAGKLLSASYKTPEGLSVELQQQWDITSSPWNQINPDEIVWEEDLWDGTTLYCFIGSGDHTFTALTAWRDQIIVIYADDGVPYQAVLQAIGLKEE